MLFAWSAFAIIVQQTMLNQLHGQHKHELSAGSSSAAQVQLAGQTTEQAGQQEIWQQCHLMCATPGLHCNTKHI